MPIGPTDRQIVNAAIRGRPCRYCEFFDGGGINQDGEPIKFHGDCHNRQSPRFTTTADDTCDKWARRTDYAAID